MGLTWFEITKDARLIGHEVSVKRAIEEAKKLGAHAVTLVEATQVWGHDWDTPKEQTIAMAPFGYSFPGHPDFDPRSQQCSIGPNAGGTSSGEVLLCKPLIGSVWRRRGYKDETEFSVVGVSNFHVSIEKKGVSMLCKRRGFSDLYECVGGPDASLGWPGKML